MTTAPARATETVRQPRRVERLVQGQATSDGAGVKLTRVLTQPLQRRLDPFLMLDAFGTDDPKDYIGGFPDHPHRGFETITYMIAGRMRHRDSAGHEGLLQNGGVQWMTAGRGVIHSELPEQEDGVMEGFQYVAKTIDLKPGDTIVLFTDGVTDAYNTQNEAFGPKGILAALQSPGLTPAQVGERIIQAVKKAGVNLPVVVRLEGTNADKARTLLAASGLAITVAKDVSDAATKAVRLARQGTRR